MSLDSRPNYQKQRSLPIFKHKNDIIEAIQNYQVIIIFGDTGSGKTTQLPQYIYEHNLNNDKEIIITQPRRIAAINMAKRVAEEIGCKLGDKVGYEIRFEKLRSSETKINFITDGILLNKFIKDPDLCKFGVIIIDEAHERSICTDVIIGLLKILVKRRKDLKVIITSATIKSQKFSEYFNVVPVIRVDGKMHLVEHLYEPFEDNIQDKIYDIVSRIHTQNCEGDILIFLTGEEDIQKCCETLKNMKRLVILPLYAAMDYESQQEVFKPVKERERKVIVSTNIAETSITIDGIRFVIDAGFVKQSSFDFKTRMEILKTIRISRSQADQRKGRAGRTNTGWCYRLYSIEDFKLFPEEIEPEILRNDLCQIALKLFSMNINPFTFEFMDKPQTNNLRMSEIELQNLECLDKRFKVTPLGNIVNAFPVDPIIGKVLYLSSQYDCSLDIVTIFAMLLERNIFLSSRNSRGNKGRRNLEFYDQDGDHFMFLNIFNKWIDNSRSEEWCDNYSLNYKVLKNVYQVRNQLIKIMKHHNLQIIPSSGDSNRRNIINCILNVYSRQICRFQSPGIYKNIHNGMTFYVHPSSCLLNKHNEMILYHNAHRTKKPFINGLLNISEDIYKEFLQERKPDQMRNKNINLTDHFYITIIFVQTQNES